MKKFKAIYRNHYGDVTLVVEVMVDTAKLEKRDTDLYDAIDDAAYDRFVELEKVGFHIDGDLELKDYREV